MEPGPGGDPIRNPGVLPTGKNIHALDPQSIPTTAAIKNAKVSGAALMDKHVPSACDPRPPCHAHPAHLLTHATPVRLLCPQMVVDRLLDRQAADNGGKYPESIAVVLWGTDNIKTYGESLAQVRDKGAGAGLGLARARGQ